MIRVISSDDQPDPKAELSELVEAGLGHTVSDATLTELFKMQERLQSRIGEAVAQLAQNKISRKSYLEKLNLALADASRMGEMLIGAEDFHRVFGNMTAENLIDTRVFFERKD
jgi:hypothetical protein